MHTSSRRSLFLFDAFSECDSSSRRNAWTAERSAGQMQQNNITYGKAKKTNKNNSYQVFKAPSKVRLH